MYTHGVYIDTEQERPTEVQGEELHSHKLFSYFIRIIEILSLYLKCNNYKPVRNTNLTQTK